MSLLSKQIGVWDNASKKADKQQKENAYGEIQTCFMSDSSFHQCYQKGTLKIYEHGSFACNNDITGASDLDMHVAFKSADIPNLKKYLQELLVKKYGKNNVKRNNLTLTVKGHANRVSTDILPCRSRKNESKVTAYSDKNSTEIDFFPKEDKDNINRLDAECNHNYSKMVRAYKGLKHEMVLAGCKGIPSFIIECLLYNVPEHLYKNENYPGLMVEERNLKMFLDIKATLFSDQLKDYESGQKWREINGYKSLFHDKNHFNLIREFFVNVNFYIKESYELQ